MNASWTWKLCVTGAIVLFALAQDTKATIINGGFETGSFAPWTFSGGAGVATAAFGTPPSAGTYHALMETGPSAQSTIGTLETFLGVPGGSIVAFNPTPPGHPLVEGSAIRQTGVTIAAGESISFDFNFLTDETTAVSDTAFWTLSSTSLTGVFFLADPVTAPLGITFTPFASETGYFNVNSGPLPAGTYTIGFGVADYGVTTVASGLLIDDVTINPVPEPSTIVLAPIGLLGLVILRWRVRRNKDR